MNLSDEAQRRAFSQWLRTGRWPHTPLAASIERKFNPYHDPRNGQFTFAPGGPRSLSQIIISDRRRVARVSSEEAAPAARRSGPNQAEASRPLLSDAVYRVEQDNVVLQPVGGGQPPSRSRRSGGRVPRDFLTLNDVFPGLATTPGDKILELAANLLEIGNPQQELTTQLSADLSNMLINQIRMLDPNYHFESFGFPETLKGQINQINALRFDRAVAFFRQKGELGPMQVETLRLIQKRTDEAYQQGIKLLQSGELKITATRALTLGNYVDRQVRDSLREKYNSYGIDSSGSGPIRVNRRENNSSGDDTYRRPDSRVGRIAFEISMQEKDLTYEQIIGFFKSDFRPDYVVVIRPSQIGSKSVYIITRPESI